LDKTERLLEGVRRGLEEAKDRERHLSGAGVGPASIPLPDRGLSNSKNGIKERVWAWSTNGAEKDHGA